MSAWRARAEEVLRGEDNRDNRDKSPKITPNVSNVPNVPGPQSLFAEWRDALRELDRYQPPGGFDRTRWLNLVECSVWWLGAFGRQAALDGWTSIDIFGIDPETPGAGGLIDRLGKSRSLVMESKRVRWRSFGVPMKFNAGAYRSLPLFWEIRDQ